MNFLNIWLQGIIVAVIVATIIELIMPNGNNKKYIKAVLGVYVLFNIITPIVDNFTAKDFKVSSIIDIDKYEKELNEYELKHVSNNIDQTNKDKITKVYISNLENDIKAKIEEKNYIVDKVNVKVNTEDEYKIEKIDIYLKDKKEEMDDKENELNKRSKETNIETIDKVEKINIKISENEINRIEKNEENMTKDKTNISDLEKKKIKEYISNTYEVKEKQIDIY